MQQISTGLRGYLGLWSADGTPGQAHRKHRALARLARHRHVAAQILPPSGGYVHSRTLRPPSYVAHDARDSFTEVSLINLAPLRRGFSFGRLLI